jgi:hypothetical protein
MIRANNVVGLRCANPTYVASDDAINGIKPTSPQYQTTPTMPSDDAMNEIKP